jgi:hypothetical protein
MNPPHSLLCCIASLALQGCEAAHPQARVEVREHTSGQEVMVTFDRPIDGRASNQYWLAVARPADPDAKYLYRKDLVRGSTSSRLDRLPPGEYELRLHANFPVKEHDVVHRQSLRIVGAAERAGAR